MRPRGLTMVTVLLAALTVAGLFLPQYQSVDSLFVLGIFPAVLIALTLWFLWRGRDWARWLVLLGAALVAIPNAVLFGVYDFSLVGNGGVMARSVYVSEGILALYVMYYLNRAKVREYFSREKWSRAG